MPYVILLLYNGLSIINFLTLCVIITIFKYVTTLYNNVFFNLMVKRDSEKFYLS